jgi:hypothetical protein
MIQFISVRASQVASKNSNVNDAVQESGDEQKQREVNKMLQEFTAEAASAPENDQEDW